MGIYPETEYTKSRDGTVTEVYNDYSGLIRIRILAPILEIEERHTCYCCSCGERFDPFCRNHGWAATRRCELHEMPGDEFVPDTTTLLASVQQERARNAT